MKILPGFLHNWAVRTRAFCCDSAEEKMSDNYCTSNRLNSRSSYQNHIYAYGVHLDESIISCLYDIISRREHILCLYCIILNLGFVICSKKLYTV